MKVSRLTGAPDSIEAFYYLRECQPLATLELEKSSIQLFPNPVSQFFSLKNPESVRYLTLCDANGKINFGATDIEATFNGQINVSTFAITGTWNNTSSLISGTFVGTKK